MSTFQFKQFTIQQNQSAMKVGTDSIILGSWIALADENSILDIGTGTGILALMLAQRSVAQAIDAVEISAIAFEEAVANFENSSWADRLFCYHTSIQNFAEEVDDKYDLIVANPPYFDPTFFNDNQDKSIARQTFELSHYDLLKATDKLLSENGTCAFVIPYKIETYFINMATDMGLFPFRILHTKDTDSAPIKRSFLHFKSNMDTCETDVLVLKKSDKSYSDAFKELTKDFYRDF